LRCSYFRSEESYRQGELTLKLALAQRRGVGRDEDQLRLSAAKRFQSASVSEDDFAALDNEGQLPSGQSSSKFLQHFRSRTFEPMDWASFLFFLGAIAVLFG